MAEGLQHDLGRLKPSDLGISEYSQMYLNTKLQSLPRALARAVYIINSVQGGNGRCLIEYGGGIGLLSMLAKRMGATVVYNDIYGVSCRDARTVARAVSTEADHYVEGGIDELVEFCMQHGIAADAVVSQDVLEHVYDIDDFLSKLHLISHGTMMHTSGANVFFPPSVRELAKTHVKAETEDRERKWGHKERDCLRAFSKVRATIIGDYVPSLGADEVRELATRTRGLAGRDILKSVKRCLATREYPETIEHPTNTCDPYTGNWAERLMNPYYLQETLSFSGFSAKVLPTPWPSGNGVISRLAAGTLNVLASAGGLYFTSTYSLYGRYNGKFSNGAHRQEMYLYPYSPLWPVASLFWKIIYRLRWA